MRGVLSGLGWLFWVGCAWFAGCASEFPRFVAVLLVGFGYLEFPGFWGLVVFDMVSGCFACGFVVECLCGCL